MRRFPTSMALSVVLVTMVAGPALAFHCPALVKECQTTADIVASREGSDKAAVTKARMGCDEAMKLHQDGKHKEAQVRVGQAIADVSKALK
jgi:hypothetical protein